MQQILLYDDKEMHVFDVVGYFPQPVEFTEHDVTMLEDMFQKKAIIPNCTYQAEIRTGETKAELDPTTMKRIAKYNLDKDFDELNKQIGFAESRLKHLEVQEKQMEEKLDFIKELFCKIVNDEDFDKESYLTDEDDCGEDYWE